MGLLLFITGFVGIFVSVILLLVDFIQRRPLRYNWISLVLSVTLIVFAHLSIPSTQWDRSGSNQTNIPFDPALNATHPNGEMKKTNEEVLQLQQQLRDITHRAFGSRNGFDGKDSIIQLDYDPSNQSVFISVFGKDGLTTNLIKRTMWHDAHEVLKSFVLINEVASVSFQIVMPTQTDQGDSMYTAVMKMAFEADTFAQIDWSEFTFEKIPKVADRYWTHQALQ